MSPFPLGSEFLSGEKDRERERDREQPGDGGVTEGHERQRSLPGSLGEVRLWLSGGPEPQDHPELRNGRHCLHRVLNIVL